MAKSKYQVEATDDSRFAGETVYRIYCLNTEGDKEYPTPSFFESARKARLYIKLFLKEAKNV